MNLLELKKDKRGFTIMELAIASSVFSLMILVAVTGVMAIGRSYIKGYISTQTQDVNRNIVDQITQAIQNSQDDILVANSSEYTALGLQPSNIFWFCIGEIRYTVNYNYVLGDPADTPPGKEAFVQDTDPPNDDCQTPFTSSYSGDVVTELLNKNMQVLYQGSNQDVLTPIDTGNGQSDLYKINLDIMYGDAGTYNKLATPYICTPDSQNDGFCAISNVVTYVEERTTPN